MNKEPSLIQKQTIETKNTGSVDSSIFFRYIQAGVWGILGMNLIFVLFLFSSTLTTLAHWRLGRWANLESIRYSSNMTDQCLQNQYSAVLTMSEGVWQQTRNVYLYSFSGTFINFVLKMFMNSVILFLLTQGFVILAISVLFIRTTFYFYSNHIATRTLHNEMFHTILRTPILFFDSNPIGKKILNN